MRKRNKFSLSNYHLFTCDMGYLVPFNWFEVIPGDYIQMQTSMLIRCTPLLAPIMHPVDVRIAHFYVPLADIWDEFEQFITGGEDGDDATVPPYFPANGYDLSGYESSLYDYLGIPPVDYQGTGINFSNLPVRAYNAIFNEYYRDQDLVAERANVKTSGSDITSANNLASIAWEKDYFTTARTSPQKGTAITIPMGLDELPVDGIGHTTSPSYSIQSMRGPYDSQEDYSSVSIHAGNAYFKEDAAHAGYPDIKVDLTGLGIDIDDFRLAMALQRYMERTNRYGSRYSDYLRQLGIRPLNARRGIPEIIGSSRQSIQFSEVLDHTSAGTLGDMAGHGISALRSNRARKFIPEHGIVMSMLSVRPKTLRSQGLHKSFNKTIKEEYHQMEMENIGDQPILCKEIYVESADPDDTFGYQDIYDEYRSMPSRISGEFRSVNDHWHMGIDYASEPALNSTFITATPRKDVFASSGTDGLYVMASNSVKARRPIRRRK